MRLTGQTALITGAGSGLGRQTALLFAREGAKVAVTDLSADRARAVSTEIEAAGGTALAIAADVRDESAVAAATDAAEAALGPLDVVFANAGVVVSGRGETPIDQLSSEEWADVVGTNLTGVFHTCKHAARVMKPRRRGVLIATSSAASFVAYPGMAAYSASKGGVNALVKGLAFELGGYGIRVNAVCPTHGMSPNFLMPLDAPVIGRSYEESAGPWDPVASPVPLKLSRPPGLQDNANAVLFLASDESAYMSGVCLPVADGGTLSRVAIQFEDDWLDDVVPQ